MERGRFRTIRVEIVSGDETKTVYDKEGPAYWLIYTVGEIVDSIREYLEEN